MLDVAWNSVVVGFQPKKNWKNSLSFLEWRMCFRNPNLDQQHPLQAVLPNCPLAKNRNRTSRAWAWRGPHPLHIIVFSVRWPAKASNDKISKLSCKIQHGQNICTMKVCSTCSFEEKSFLIYWSLFISHFVHKKRLNIPKSIIFGAKSVSSLVSLQLQCKLSTLPFGSLYLTFFAMSSRLRGKGTLEWLNTKLHFSNC